MVSPFTKAVFSGNRTRLKRLVSAAFLIVTFVSAAGTFPVIVNGKPVVNLSPRPEGPAEVEAAMILEKYLYLITGKLPEITDKGRRIVFQIEKGKMDQEGFRFTFPSEEIMVITGGGPLGLKFGALTFCEKYLGIRFLFPGKLGLHLPKVRNLAIARKEYRDAPRYLTRYLWASRHKSQNEFNKWFPLQKGVVPYRVRITHNLYNMFPPAKYAEKHPEFYPIINGKRFIPKPPRLGVHWQPCMTNPGVIKEAVRMNCEAFAADPDLRSWSLCQTDGNGYCECDGCRKFYPKNDVPHRFGSKDRSMLYLQFCNKIAEQVAKKYPDAKLTLYAYNHASIAPKNYPLHPALIPIITYDRANHLDAERKKMDQERQKEWRAISSEICWYDYLYTNAFVLPRVLTRHLAGRLREGHKSGVRHFFGEYSPVDGQGLLCDGPFSYIAFKLLWNPYQDENALLDEWYHLMVGDKAAPYLKSYFDRIEKFWTQKVPKSSWFKRCARTYHVMTWHEYLNVLDPDFLELCEKDLQRCRELAPAGICRQRAEYFLKGFHFRKFMIEYVLKNLRAKLIADSEFTETVFTDNFDKGLGNWRPYQRHYAPGKVIEFSATKGKGGTGALVHPSRNGAASIAEKYFTVTKDGDFLMTVDYRCEGTEKKVVPYISAEWCDMKGNILHSVYYTDIHGRYHKDWARMKVKFTAAGKLPARLRVRLNFYNTRTGCVYLDNFVLKSTQKDILRPEPLPKASSAGRK